MKLLSDAQVQRFLRDGYLTLQANLSADFHAQVRTQIDDLFRNEGNPGNDILPKVPDLYRVLRDEHISGALASVLGPDYIVHPHRHCHQNLAGSSGQGMHQDSYPLTISMMPVPQKKIHTNGELREKNEFVYLI